MAVPGFDLNGDPNHAQATWTKGDKLWLKDFLPGYLSNPARVMLFAYDSRPSFSVRAVNFGNHAENLLQYLSLRRVVSCADPVLWHISNHG